VGYDELYKQMDFSEKPFGYAPDYLKWRNTKLKGSLAKHITGKGRILDVGGGTGSMAQFLPDFIDKGNYYNLDVSIEMLRYSPYENILAAAEELPFYDNSFDYVISSEALEHVGDKTKVLKECYRVLRPKGLFLLSTPRSGWKDDFMRSQFRPFLMIEWALAMLHPRRIAQVPHGVRDEPSDERWLREKLKSIGFTVIKQYRADNHLPWGKAGESKFWRWFADRFVDPRKYGHCTIVICKKEKS
jgi:ubiquinone/menaquinone biosynthesis C-methylase UbiE